jgi:short subunit dehydrogenase-like uncharacterized protein
MRMAGRIVLFGATGYTGGLTAAELAAAGAPIRLAGRDHEALTELAAGLGGKAEPEVAIADVGDPDSVRALLEPGDVMLSTVGPFARWGAPAIEAAIDAGVPYIDSTGEPTFIRRVFEEWGPQGERSGAPLLTALGYDWAPGNLAGALALRDAGAGARTVEIGYFITGSGGSAGGMSGGTMASLAGALLEPGFAFREGRIVTERGGRRVRDFQVGGRSRQAISIGSSEHFTLPAISPGLADVEAFLGWFGPMSRPMQAGSAAIAAATRVPGAKGLIGGVTGRFVKGSTGGPSEEERSKSGSHVVANVRDEEGEVVATAKLEGVDGYTFTSRFLAWAARRALAGGIEGAGALGPAAAFGLDRFEAGVAESGIRRA